MAGEGVGGLLVPDVPLMCPTGTSVEEAHTSCFCPKLPEGCYALGCPGKGGGPYLWGKGSNTHSQLSRT